MVNIIKLGSFSLNGNPVPPGVQCYSGHDQVDFLDTAPGMEISWVDTGSLLVATRCICTGISWNALDQAGFISGTRIWIDEVPYLCRCLKGGAREGEINEWDDILKQYRDSDNLWYWNRNPFWCQENPPDYGMRYARVVRGGKNPSEWSTGNWNLGICNIGFLPVLERISRFKLDFKGLEGKEICVYGPHNQFVSGWVLGVDDYDLVLTTNIPLPPHCNWAIRSEHGTMIRRESIWDIKQLNQKQKKADQDFWSAFFDIAANIEFGAVARASLASAEH